MNVALPKAPKIAPDELVGLGERYARAGGYPIQYQWTLLKSVNDSQDKLDAILRLLKSKYAAQPDPRSAARRDAYQRRSLRR